MKLTQKEIGESSHGRMPYYLPWRPVNPRQRLNNFLKTDPLTCKSPRVGAQLNLDPNRDRLKVLGLT